MSFCNLGVVFCCALRCARDGNRDRPSPIAASTGSGAVRCPAVWRVAIDAGAWFKPCSPFSISSRSSTTSRQALQAGRETGARHCESRCVRGRGDRRGSTRRRPLSDRNALPGWHASASGMSSTPSRAMWAGLGEGWKPMREAEVVGSRRIARLMLYGLLLDDLLVALRSIQGGFSKGHQLLDRPDARRVVRFNQSFKEKTTFRGSDPTSI